MKSPNGNESDKGYRLVLVLKDRMQGGKIKVHYSGEIETAQSRKAA